MSDEDLEQQLYDLQEEFQALQEQAAEVEQRQERRVCELEAALHKLQQQNDGLNLEKLDLQSRLSEKDDEIRYLQTELEGALCDRQKEAESTITARQSAYASIACVRQSLEAAQSIVLGVLRAPPEPGAV